MVGGVLGVGQVVVGMARGDRRTRAALLQPPSRVLAQRLQQPVPGPAGAVRLPADERPVDQAREGPEHVGSAETLVATDHLDGLVVEAAPEDRQALEDDLLVLAEQVVAPVEGRAQRPVTGGSRARTGLEQREPLAQASQELLGGEGRDARGGELDRQRQPVEPAAHLGDRRGVRGLELEPRRAALRAVDEQPDGVGPAHRLHPEVQARVGQAHRRHVVRHLARDAQRLAAGGQHAQARARRQQVGDPHGRLLGDVLAVVDHQQAARVADRRTQRLDERPVGALGDAKRPRDHPVDLVTGRRGEVREAHPVSEVARSGARDLQAEPGLAGPAGAGEREQPRRPQVPSDLRELPLPSHEARQGHRQWRHGPQSRSAELDQLAAVRRAQLAQQRGDVALHGPDRDHQPVRDLAVAQTLDHRREDLGLALRDPGPRQRLRQPAISPRHPHIVPDPLPPGRRSATRTAGSVRSTDDGACDAG